MRALVYLLAAAAAVEAEMEHRGGRVRRVPRVVKQEKDGRDVTRMKDEAKWKHEEQLVAEASQELNKLHADRDKLKEKEVAVLSRREEASKSAMADATLVIQRLEGQVASQERELARQKGVISGLERDLGTMGTALLSRGPEKAAVEPAPAPEDQDQARLVAGLEQDVERDGGALLRAEKREAAVTVREKLLGREARGLADRTRALESELGTPESAAAARPLAQAIAADARKLEHALLHNERGAEEREEEHTEEREAEHTHLRNPEDMDAVARAVDTDDVARAVELERRPGPHLEPAELEQPERIALERADERAQLQRADEQEGELDHHHARLRAPPRLVHRDPQPVVADAEAADTEDETPEEVIDPPEPAANHTLTEPALLSRDDAAQGDDGSDAAAEEEAAADDSDEEDDDDSAPAQPDAPPSPADTAPADDRAQRLSA